jgi:hypothetical protein
VNKGVGIGIAVTIAAIAIGLASPLFYDVQIDEPLPIALENIEDGLTFEKFASMDDDARQGLVTKMPEKTKDMIMQKAATMQTTVSEDMNSSQIEIIKSGSFDGLAGHSAAGLAKIIQVGDMTYLRFEDFQVTNGPDLRVYLTPDGDVSNGIHLDKLKGSKGDQNYLLENIDVATYDTVIVYCQPFGAYFGQADLS